MLFLDRFGYISKLRKYLRFFHFAIPIAQENVNITREKDVSTGKPFNWTLENAILGKRLMLDIILLYYII